MLHEGLQNGDLGRILALALLFFSELLSLDERREQPRRDEHEDLEHFVLDVQQHGVQARDLRVRRAEDAE